MSAKRKRNRWAWRVGLGRLVFVLCLLLASGGHAADSTDSTETTGVGGNAVRKELTAKGYTLLLVHPEVDTIDGQPCARSLKEIAPRVGGVLLVTPPDATSRLVREAVEAGISRVWMQQGAESDAAVRFCDEHGVAAVHHQCILTFCEPAAWPHRFHRRLRAIFGRLPR
jgi:predicted CoA-binding protein